MKKLALLLVCFICFPFLGMDTMPKEQPVKIRVILIRPTMDQLILLTESRLKRANSELKNEIATFE